MGSIRELKTKDGSTSFHAEVRLNYGQFVRRERFPTRTAAKRWIIETEAAYQEGRNVPTRDAKRQTVGDLVDRFITQWLPNYPDRLDKQTALLTWWKEQIGSTPLCNLTPGLIAEQRDKLLSGTTYRGGLRSPSTVNRYLAALGKALSVAIKEWGWLETSPLAKVSRPAEGKGRDKFLSEAQRDALLAACKRYNNPWLYPVVALALLTGMRHGEITSLRWNNLCWERRLIILDKTKNGDVRKVPITDAVDSIFKSLPTWGQPSSSLIFQSQRNLEKPTIVSIRWAFQAVCKEVGLEDFHFHDLRHAAASFLAMKGATQGELMAILGHRSPTMTRRYAHYSAEHLRSVLDRTSFQAPVDSTSTA